MSGFRKVGEAKQFRDGVGRTFSVDGREIAVFRRGDRFYAMDDKCPHMGASLSMGKLAEGKVQCAWHDWSFDLETGCNEFKKWACVAIHDVQRSTPSLEGNANGTLEFILSETSLDYPVNI